MSDRPMSRIVSALAVAGLAGCTATQEARNLEPVSRGEGYQAQYRAFDAKSDPPYLQSKTMNSARCRPYAGGDAQAGKYAAPVAAALSGEMLSRGDLVALRLTEDEVFTGDYVISRDGTLKVPFLSPIRAEGRSPEAVVADLKSALVAAEFYGEAPRVSLLVKDYAPARVAVSGAVFESHAHDIGGVPGDQVDSLRQQALGASTEARNLSVALRNAGGVRPDADLSAVRLTRNGRNYTIDLRGMISGHDANDVVLISGDEVHVPSRLCFQDDLMVPSPISPPGISLYLSNLTQPATGNAPSAIGETVRQVPYGTRYMQAVVDANCVGGARATSAARSAALFSRNPLSDVSLVMERPVEEMRQRADRDDYDPYLLPGDAIACYDSSVTNLTEVARVVGILGLASLID